MRPSPCGSARSGRHPPKPSDAADYLSAASPPELIEAPTRPPASLHLALPGPRRRYGALVASVLLHGLLVGFLVRSGDRVWSRTLAPGDPALQDRGGGGGGGGPSVAYITLPPAREPGIPRQITVEASRAQPRLQLEAPSEKPEPAVGPPVAPPPLPAPTDSVPTQPPATPPAAGAPGVEGPASAEGPGASPGAGSGAGGGVDAGLGVGQGGGAGPGQGAEGEGGTIRPPELRDLAFPFDTPPKSLRGASLAVTFWVRIDGRIERYEVEPAIDDGDYARKFDEVIRAFRFTPARAPDGTRVAGTTTVTFTLPGKRSS